MADFDNLEKKVLQKIVERMDLHDVDIENFSYTASLFSSDPEKTEECLGLDSIDILELIVLIYDEWKIKVEDTNARQLRTVKDIADFIRANYKEDSDEPLE